MTELVIFDLDGTLIDTIGDLGNACNHALKMCGCPERRMEEYNMLVGRGIYNLFRGALPEGMKTTTAFSHIHQIKGISDKEGTADVAMPVFTFTVRTLSSGKQQFQVIHVGPSPSSNTYLAKADLSEFLGEWVEATETVRFSDNGAYELVIRRISDGKTLVSVKEDDIATWREAAAGMRPKWGLYRNFGEDGSLKPELRDEVLRFADFLIEKP